MPIDLVYENGQWQLGGKPVDPTLQAESIAGIIATDDFRAYMDRKNSPDKPGHALEVVKLIGQLPVKERLTLLAEDGQLLKALDYYDHDATKKLFDATQAEHRAALLKSRDTLGRETTTKLPPPR